MSNPTRILVAGLGARSEIWLELLAAHPGVTLAGLADPDPAKQARARIRFPGVRIEPDLETLARGEPADAALLITPPYGRERQISACLDAGLHILAEKPLANSLKEAARFVAMAEAAQRLLIVGLNFRYLSVTQILRAELLRRRFGAPEIARFTYDRWRNGRSAHLNTYPLTMAHPMLWEQSIHHFDLMRYVYGCQALRVFAQCSNPAWSLYNGDTNIAALFTFETGLSLTYQGTWQGGREKIDFHWRTDCETGVLIQRDMFGDLVAAGRHDAVYAPVELPPSTPWKDDAAHLLAMFVAALAGGTPDCTGRDHLASLAMLEAVIRSSARGEPVELAEIHAELPVRPSGPKEETP